MSSVVCCKYVFLCRYEVKTFPTFKWFQQGMMYQYGNDSGSGYFNYKGQ